MSHTLAPEPDLMPQLFSGDVAFEAPRHKLNRAKVRESSKLRTAALQFWITLGLSINDRMSKSQYVYLHRLVSLVLAPELTFEEAEEAAEEDWAEDAGNSAAKTISFKIYAESLA